MRISGAADGPGGATRDRQLPADLADWPAWTPGEEQLGELELITSGAFAPLTGYLATADLAAVARGASSPTARRGRSPSRSPCRRAPSPPVPTAGAAGPGGLAARRRQHHRAVPATPRRRAAPCGPGDRAAPAGARAVPRAAPDARRGPRAARRVAQHRAVLALRDQAAARPAADRPAAAPRRPAARPHPAAAPRGGAGRPGHPPGVAGPRRARRRQAAAGEHARRPGAAAAARRPREDLLARAVVAAAYGATHLLRGRGWRRARQPHPFGRI